MSDPQDCNAGQRSAFVYSGPHYGRKHKILRRTGTMVWVEYQGDQFAVPHCDVEEERPRKRPARITMDAVVSQHIQDRLPAELALGFARYEALRRITSRQHHDLCDRNMKGENFDGMVDALVLANADAQ